MALLEEGVEEIEEVDVEEERQIRTVSDEGNPVIGVGSARRGTTFVHGVAEKGMLRQPIMIKLTELCEVVSVEYVMLSVPHSPAGALTIGQNRSGPMSGPDLPAASCRCYLLTGRHNNVGSRPTDGLMSMLSPHWSTE